MEDMEEEYMEGEIEYDDSQVAAHIRGILSKSGGDHTDDYNELVGILNKSGHLSPDQVASLVMSLKGLSGAVGSIDVVRHENLVRAIFWMSIWKYNPDVMDVLINLIVRLATSGGTFANSCLEMLVTNFMPPHKDFLNHLTSEHRRAVRKEQVLDRVHSALINITELMPLAPMRLCPIIEQRMPNIFADEEVMAIYVENMLRLESGPIGQFVGIKVLLEVMDRLVELDILQDESKTDKGGESKDESNTDKGIFDMELEDMKEEDDLDGANDKSKMARNVVAGKLDSLMVLMCQHLKSCAENGRLLEVFETLLMSFHVAVLNTQRSKFAQFVVFYACSLDPSVCSKAFVKMLRNNFFGDTGPGNTLLTRMSSVAYLASYLSRAKFLQGPVIAKTLQKLVDWCAEYCRSVDAGEKTLNPEVHRVFYAGCQAIMYVLCFRMREMLGDPVLKSQIFGFPLQLIFQHPLNPLKVCLPCIVEEFLKQAEAVSLFTTSENFLFTKLIESDLSKAFGGVERLDMFFPFDPCLLKRSHEFIKPIFLHWSNVFRPYEDAEKQLGDDADNDHLSDDEDMGRSFNDRDGMYPDDIEMSTTPKCSFSFGMEGDHEMILKSMPARIRPSTSPQ
ncbi:hypothetical protein MKW94_002434 [Papaver nudicaule]|uniref:RNA polymerase I-specific transcription initiation factor RRN3 n=1 Tax=Papaver nudicaule TaxID=74823 RepID=A0AA41V239_PAPNU|nr:hypothetical protein [Papaver nudicaule]